MNIVTFFLLLLMPVVARAQTACNLNIDAAVAQLFGVPAAEVIAQAFALAFVTPATVYLAAYLVGCLVNFWNR